MAKKYYAVRVGRVPGIYLTWDECKKQTDGFPNAEFKSFKSEDEAGDFICGKTTVITTPLPISSIGTPANTDGVGADPPW